MRAEPGTWCRQITIRAGARFGRLTIYEHTDTSANLYCDCGESVSAHVSALQRGSLLQCWKCERAVVTLALAVFRAECALAHMQGRKPRRVTAPGDDFAQIAGVVITGPELARLLNISADRLPRRAGERALRSTSDHNSLLREGMRLRRELNVKRGLCGCGQKCVAGRRRCAKCIARHDAQNADRARK